MKSAPPTDLGSYQMGPADPDKHLMAITQIVSDEFANGGYHEEISQKYIGNCHYDWEATRLIFAGEQLVHHWGVWGYPMRLETVELKVAGIGAVVTKEPYRKRGLMTKAVTDSLAAMHQLGYDLSILRGRHYVRFGYARAWNYVTYRLTAGEIPAVEANGEHKPLGPEYMDELIALYNRSHQGYTGTAVRPTYRMLTADDMQVYGWFDEDGKLAGYVRAVPTEDKKTLQCLEAAGDPQRGLAVLGELFKEEESYETLAFFTLPHHHPILQFLRRGACIVENRYFDITGWRVRIINLGSALEKMRPLLETRLQNSRFTDWEGALTLDAGLHTATLAIGKGQVKITPAGDSAHHIEGGADIARFLIGSDEPEEIIRQAGMTCSGKAAELVSVLFPNLHPVMSHWDEY